MELNGRVRIICKNENRKTFEQLFEKYHIEYNQTSLIEDSLRFDIYHLSKILEQDFIKELEEILTLYLTPEYTTNKTYAFKVLVIDMDNKIHRYENEVGGVTYFPYEIGFID